MLFKCHISGFIWKRFWTILNMRLDKSIISTAMSIWICTQVHFYYKNIKVDNSQLQFIAGPFITYDEI